MIARYSNKEMAKHWEEEARWQSLLEVEQAVANAQAEVKMIPKQAAIDIQKKAKFQINKIHKIEEQTKHDVIAFITNVAENIGKNGRYLHYGLTSSDALDTATSLQIKNASKTLKQAFQRLDKAFLKIIKKHKTTLCSGRTHGIHAEPTTFGFKMAGYYQEFLRNKDRVEEALEDCLIAKLSGAVGTYSFQSEKVEKLVAKKLGLQQEVIATQVVPRDRHAHLIMAFSLFAASMDRLCIELRHLQRTEVAEVAEGFSKGQKGSSAMPHKKNPISAENMSGLARLLKSYSQVALENVSLWHERDISHSSAERVVIPDSFILMHYICLRMTGLLDNLQVDKKRMVENMNFSNGNLFSSHILLELIEKGKLSREEAYKKVQSLAHQLKDGENLKEALKNDKEVMNYLSEKDIDKVFSGEKHKTKIEKRMNQLFGFK